MLGRSSLDLQLDKFKVIFKEDGTNYHVVIRDNGIGFAAKQISFGLSGIKQRVTGCVATSNPVKDGISISKRAISGLSAMMSFKACFPSVADNGIGFAAKQISFGLSGIKQRVTGLGGHAT